MILILSKDQVQEDLGGLIAGSWWTERQQRDPLHIFSEKQTKQTDVKQTSELSGKTQPSFLLGPQIICLLFAFSVSDVRVK